jgi:ubiquinone/menaquinone biosynthesis C-methylase UbiE
MTLADISDGMLAQVHRKIAASGMTDVEGRRLDLTKDPLPAERYDLVCLQLILHHILDTDQILGALHDILAPGVPLAVADMDLEDGSFHREAYEGYFGFDREELAAKVHTAGFREVLFDDVLTVHKVRGGVEREYPMFLMIARP